MARQTSPNNTITQNGKTVYLTNKELLVEIHKSKEKGQMTDMLARMLQLLCLRLSKKGNFVNYSYIEDMRAYAMMMLVRTWNSFDPKKSSNPFSYFTQSITNSYIQFLNQEKRHRVIRDELLIDQGMSPSFSFSSSSVIADDEQDYDHIVETAQTIQNLESVVNEPIERDDSGNEIVVDVSDGVDDN